MEQDWLNLDAGITPDEARAARAAEAAQKNRIAATTVTDLAANAANETWMLALRRNP